MVEVGVDRLTVSGDLLGEVDEGGELSPAGPDQPFVECFFAFFSFDPEHVAESFFEEVGPPQFWIGFGDPVELLALTRVEGVGVLPQRVAGSGDLSGVASSPPPPARRG